MKIRPPRASCELCSSRSTHVIEWDLLDQGVDAQGQIAHCASCEAAAWEIVPFGASGMARSLGVAPTPDHHRPGDAGLAQVIDITARLRSA